VVTSLVVNTNPLQRPKSTWPLLQPISTF